MMKSAIVTACVAVLLLVVACRPSTPPDEDGTSGGGELIDDLFSGQNPPWEEGDMRIPGYDQYLSRNGIGQEYSPENEAALEKAVAAWLDRLEDRLAEIDAAKERGGETAALKDEKKDIRKRQPFLEYCLELLETAQAEGVPEAARVSAFHLGKRITYVVASMRPDDEPEDFHERLRRRFETIETYTAVVMRHALKEVQFRMPYLEADALDEPLGEDAAALEARFLVDPEDPTRFASIERLATMSTRQVAELDVSDRHPGWRTEAASAEHPDAWAELEAWMERRITRKLDKDHDVKDDFPDFSYRLSAARKVLFFDKLKSSASSAKIKGEDAFGVNWKIKWGDEVQTEPVANRLWMRLGGKFTDLVYVNGSGREHLTLVLSDPSKAEDQDDDSCYPVVYEDLRKCLLESSYEFNLDPYKYETGELTADNIDQVLTHLPAEALEDFRKKDLVGRHYVTFRESMVEVDPPGSVVRRGGATSFSGVGARQDRVARGLFLFNMWIWNQDAKDDNNRGVLLKDYIQDDWSYYEAQHDMGLSFGGILAYGTINEMKVADDFAHVVKKPAPRIFFRQHAFYNPKAWNDTTYADGLWIAHKLMGLSRADVEAAVAHSLWPDFMQEALTYKLMARRNHIARLFHLEVPADQEVSPPDVEVPLTTEADRRAAAERYQLDPAWIDEAMGRAGLLGRGLRRPAGRRRSGEPVRRHRLDRPPPAPRASLGLAGAHQALLRRRR